MVGIGTIMDLLRDGLTFGRLVTNVGLVLVRRASHSVGAQCVAWRGAEGRLLCPVRGKKSMQRSGGGSGSGWLHLFQMACVAEHHGKCSERTRGQD